ncbi:MAG: endonuclease V [Euryarchaeota archaeon]|nr:endonuclease V [Euryarchaeota archaeon]
MNLTRFAEVQKRLSRRVVLEDGFEEVERIAGVDAAYSEDACFAAAVVVELKTLRTVEEKTAMQKVHVPYIPGFFAFREMGAVIKALRRLRSGYDLLMVEGHGIAHPSGCGFASHLGVLLRRPSIGVAKRLLCGSVRGTPSPERPAEVVLNGKVVGYAVKSGGRVIYVSPGNMVSLTTALEVVKRTTLGHALPEPVRRAHLLAARARRGY